MKFCYVDESGKGSEPVLVLAGIIADAHRMHVTKSDWLAILQRLSNDVQRPIEEFHTRHFYKGNGIWRSLNGQQRTAVLNRILEWMNERNHKVAFAAVDKGKVDPSSLSDKNNFVRNDKPSFWKLAAIHLLLSIQKYHQSNERKKGHTVMVFDNGNDPEEIAEIVLSPPTWTDSFYDYQREIRKRRASIPNPDLPLNMIVDVPYFADSRHVGMLQIADLFSYLLRHHAELQAGYTNPDYPDEKDKVSSWVSRLATLLVPDNFRWKVSGGCECNKFFRSIAPEPLIDIHRRAPQMMSVVQTAKSRRSLEASKSAPTRSIPISSPQKSSKTSKPPLPSSPKSSPT